MVVEHGGTYTQSFTNPHKKNRMDWDHVGIAMWHVDVQYPKLLGEYKITNYYPNLLYITFYDVYILNKYIYYIFLSKPLKLGH